MDEKHWREAITGLKKVVVRDVARTAAADIGKYADKKLSDGAALIPPASGKHPVIEYFKKRKKIVSGYRTRQQLEGELARVETVLRSGQEHLLDRGARNYLMAFRSTLRKRLEKT